MRLKKAPEGYGEWLRFYREREELTQRQLAEEADVSYVTVNHLENGRRKASDAVERKLAKALGVRRSMLFPTNGMPTPTQIIEKYLKHYRQRKAKA